MPLERLPAEILRDFRAAMPEAPRAAVLELRPALPA
jgi:hypothetical protein